jgi:hypothetical protein
LVRSSLYFFFTFFVDEEREETERLPDELLTLELEEELRGDDLNEEVLLREGDTDLGEKDLVLEELLLGDTYERLVLER